MVNDTSIELDNVVIPVYKGNNRIYLECDDQELRTWAYHAMASYDLVISPEHKGKKYVFITSLEFSKESDSYSIDVQLFVDALTLFFHHYPNEALCISTNILNQIDEYIETEIYDFCTAIKGTVNFNYGRPVQI